jgi:hypothetical protein
MHNRITSLILCSALGVLLQPAARAWPGGCLHTADRDAQVALDGAKRIVIRAGAGDLAVHGIRNGTAIKAHGKACAPTLALLAQTNVSIAREGDAIVITSVIPGDSGPKFSLLWGGDDPYVDIDVQLPQEIPVSLDDTSGDTVVSNIAGGSIHDTSGDLAIHGVTGDLDVVDSSGDLLIDGVGGSLSLDDSSGDIVIRNVKGNVLVRNDSSGDIGIANAGAKATISNDSSGDVNIDEVAGDFTLEAKGSGDVHVHGVHGQVRIPDDKK